MDPSPSLKVTKSVKLQKPEIKQVKTDFLFLSLNV